jgi:hypothetical protein
MERARLTSPHHNQSVANLTSCVYAVSEMCIEIVPAIERMEVVPVGHDMSQPLDFLHVNGWNGSQLLHE